jgi:hypothetical protein
VKDDKTNITSQSHNILSIHFTARSQQTNMWQNAATPTNPIKCFFNDIKRACKTNLVYCPKISHNTYLLKYMAEKEYLLYTRSLEQMDACHQVIGNKP